MSTGAAAVGIAQINAVGNLGGFVGTYSLGIIKEATGSYALGPFASRAFNCGRNHADAS